MTDADIRDAMLAILRDEHTFGPRATVVQADDALPEDLAACLEDGELPVIAVTAAAAPGRVVTLATTRGLIGETPEGLAVVAYADISACLIGVVEDTGEGVMTLTPAWTDEAFEMQAGGADDAAAISALITFVLTRRQELHDDRPPHAAAAFEQALPAASNDNQPV